MMRSFNVLRESIALFAIPTLFLLAAILLTLSVPEEATLGNGIKIVAVHVALIWAGMLGLIAAGIVGTIVLIRPNQPLQLWMNDIATVALLIFALGVGTSLIAEIINWGGIAWNEPRTGANLNLLALAIVLQVGGSWFGGVRLRAATNLGLAIAVVWTTLITDVQLHPSGAVSSSSSTNIQFTFYALTLCCLIIGAWAIWFLNSKKIERARHER